MSNPQNPQQGNPNQHYVPEGYELAKKKKPFYKRLGCLIPLAVLLVIIVVVAISSGGGDDNGGDASGDIGEQTEYQPGETFTTENGLEITMTAFGASTDAMGTQYACAEIAYTNSGDEQESFQGYWDWKLQNPAGVITDPALTGENTLDSGELAPGGNVSGSVCFEGTEPGEYRLVYEPTLSFGDDTATWIATL